MSWLDQLHPESGDRIIQAINYTNGCRPFMMNYLKDGACSLSNNLSENSIRPLVVGRKNWLFSDTPAVGGCQYEGLFYDRNGKGQ